MIKWWRVSTFILAVAVWPALAPADEGLTADNAWVREAPPNAETSAAYLVIHNGTNQPKILQGVSSPQFQGVEIHSTQMAGSQVHMMRMNELSIAPGDEARFSPGGYHLMLMKPLKALKSGDVVTLLLQFKDGPQLAVEAPVRSGSDMEESKPHHMHNMDDMKM